jgi:hypothetical protein
MKKIAIATIRTIAIGLATLVVVVEMIQLFLKVHLLLTLPGDEPGRDLLVEWSVRNVIWIAISLGVVWIAIPRAPKRR